MRDPSEVPALLTMPHYTGTLAAARCLGARGVPLLLATDQWLAPASWSKYVKARFRCPPVAKGPAAYRDWLMRFGAEHRKTLLYPTSDDTAWTITSHAAQLEPYFHLYSPPLSALRVLLDKSALYAACVRLRVPCPTTYMPESPEDVAALSSRHAKMIVKPRSQVFFISGAKGEICATPRALVDAWSSHRSMVYAPGMREAMPGIELPLLQEYIPAIAEGTYSLSGFVDRSGTLLGLRASTKVVQYPPKVGVGYYFIEAPVHDEALQAVVALCRDVGFFGVFEVEFVRRGNQLLLVDFNPRYYGQMGFDIARGTPLPWMVQLAALGREAELPALLERSARASRKPTVYRHRIALTWNALSSFALGRATLDDTRQMMHAAARMPGAVDAAIDHADMGPALAAGASAVLSTVYRPRGLALRLKRFMGVRQPEPCVTRPVAPAPSAPAQPPVERQRR